MARDHADQPARRIAHGRCQIPERHAVRFHGTGGDDAEPGTVARGDEPGVRCNVRSPSQLAVRGAYDPAGVRGGNPSEFRVGCGQLAENLVQTIRVRVALGGLHDAPGRVDRIEAARERLAELGTQLIRFEQQAPDVLFQQVLPGDAAHPDSGRHGKGDRQSDDQPHRACTEAVPRVHSTKPVQPQSATPLLIAGSTHDESHFQTTRPEPHDSTRNRTEHTMVAGRERNTKRDIQ